MSPTELELRHYAVLVAARGGNTFETCLEYLADGRDVARLFAWLDKPLQNGTQERVNEKMLEKLPERAALLRQLDLDSLEQEVRERCLPASSGLAENFNRFMQECAR